MGLSCRSMSSSGRRGWFRWLPWLVLNVGCAATTPPPAKAPAAVGLAKELEYKAGAVWPHQRRVIQMPVAVGDRPRTPPQPLESPAPVIGIRTQSVTDSRMGKLVGFTLLVGAIASFVAVSVFRNQPGLNRLPTFFAKLFNVQDQGVQAQAIGTAAPANSTACLWPLAIPDKWSGTGVLAWSTTAPPQPRMFFKYDWPPGCASEACATIATNGNTYTAPTSVSGGTGFRMLPTTLNTNKAVAIQQSGQLSDIQPDRPARPNATRPDQR